MDNFRNVRFITVLVIELSSSSARLFSDRILIWVIVSQICQLPILIDLSIYATNRIRTAARILRLGYNMMFLDTDIIIFDDPYK